MSSPASPHASATPIIVPEQLSDLAIVPSQWGWRKGQRELVQQIVDSKRKIVMLEAECGTGKSIISIAAARAAGISPLVLIQTINLQEQYMRDFYTAKMLMGRRNYMCRVTERPADKAPCMMGMRCEHKGQWDYAAGVATEPPSCDYFAAKADAAVAEISIQNYAYWLGETRNPKSIFRRQQWIICDEGHELDQILMAAATLEFSQIKLDAMQITDYPDGRGSDISQWVTWAKQTLPRVMSLVASESKRLEDKGYIVEKLDDSEAKEASPLSTFEADTELYRQLKELSGQLTDVIREVDPSPDDWVLDVKPNVNHFTAFLKPIFGKYGFQRIVEAATDKIIIQSAFLAPKMLIETLGLDPNDVEIIEAPQAFNRARSPVLWCPTVKMSHGAPAAEVKYLVNVMDMFIDFYMPKKGIIHVPSVALRDVVLNNSRHRSLMITYEGAAAMGNLDFALDKDAALDRFTKIEGPAILLAQSASTGVDLPNIPQWQIIPKVWFAPTNDPAIAARRAKDPNFYPYDTICKLVQATGRVKRSQEHDGPTIILDNHFGWFFMQNRESFPSWFKKALVYRGWNNFPNMQRRLPQLAFQQGIMYDPLAKKARGES